MFDRKTAVGQIVAERPSASRTFERLGIDYCCGGRKPLEEACAEKGLDPQAVLGDLGAESGAGGSEERNWSEASLPDLADHIVRVHHGWLRENLPRLDALSAKVVRAHGDRHPELARVREVLLSLIAELGAHTMKEERVLFPMIVAIDGASEKPCFHCGSIANPLGVMEEEHESAGRALVSLRSLTRDFSTPADGCATYRAFMDGLAELEADLHRHIHEENNILFPRAAARERELPEA